MEQKIQHIVKETVEHYIMDNILLEYAHNRAEFKRILQGLSEPLIVHWCLIRWGRLTGNTQTLPHWKSEVISYWNRINKLSLKEGDKSQKRLTAILEVWDKEEFITNVNAIKFTIYSKFTKEGINVEDDAVVTEVCNGFIQDAPHIVEILANKDSKAMREYINSL